MAGVAVLASGSGSNFEAIVTALAPTAHRVVLLLCDKPGAGCLERASRLGIPFSVVTYAKGGSLEVRQSAERQMILELEACGAELVVLAGFMRILTPLFVSRWKGKLINIHPSLLPKHPGPHGIADSFASSDQELGVTVHWVDEGVDTGSIIAQRSFSRSAGLTLEEVENRIHTIEHALYPEVVLAILSALS